MSPTPQGKEEDRFFSLFFHGIYQAVNEGLSKNKLTFQNATSTVFFVIPISQMMGHFAKMIHSQATLAKAASKRHFW